MAIDLKQLIQSRKNTSPPRILVYGVQGCGKTEFASNSPAPVFIFTEDGAGSLPVNSFPLAKSYDDVMTYITALCTEDHSYKTLVVDSLDWFEPLVWGRLVQDNSTASKTLQKIEEIGYGKGYTMALDYWREYLDAINFLRNEKDMAIIQIAHSDVKRFESPSSDSYDRYTVKLHAKASALLQEHSDCVFFANYSTHVTEEKLGFNNTRKRAVGGDQRFIYTQERPAYAAKNRYGLPESILLEQGMPTWEVLAKHIPWFDQFTNPATTQGE